MSTIQAKCPHYDKLKKKLRGTGFNDNWMIQPHPIDTVLLLRMLEKQSKENEFSVPFEGTNYDCTHRYNLLVIGLEVYTFKEMYEILEILIEHHKECKN